MDKALLGLMCLHYVWQFAIFNQSANLYADRHRSHAYTVLIATKNHLLSGKKCTVQIIMEMTQLNKYELV